ncbi:MAG: glycosyltransferase [Butyrivibrio sp.]|uniref:glycosyltransferase family 2 protein n=1 Tax=Butyrivibrio sp. TaxID=28121 RepID=UPI0025BD8405|nr:glycosyltransferase family 2 protein [Butyrivibrio sp.]MBQ6589056.1 glycosyltransferase [Butyrivibrio sp.]
MPLAGNKTISIIIPVYQAVDTLRRCVLSCLNQKDLDPGELEIILVDDGSTDGSRELCDELAHEDASGRVRAIHTENGGVSRARNIGIEAAVGRFIVFVDSDDAVKDGLISNMIKHADESTLLVDETNNYSVTNKISGYQYIENVILHENTHVWGKLFDRETLMSGNVRFIDGLTIGEDLLFLIDYALYVDKKRGIRCIADGDYIYTENENSAMNRAFKKSYLDQIKCWRMAEDKLLEVKENISPYAFVSVAVSQILTAFLVVGKVATQGAERDAELDNEAVEMVTEQIKHALKTRGAFAGLPAGHKLKVMVYRLSPKLYIDMYARHKGAKQ